MKDTRFGLLSIRSFRTAAICLIMLLSCVVSSTPFTANGALPASQRAALAALYSSTNGDAWNDNSGWKTGPLDTDGFAMPGTENTWHGITINGEGVAEIILSNNNLTGAISSELCNLTQLSQLNLAINQLSGPIPSEMGNLTNLSCLDLGNNKLTGAIPPELGNLHNLSRLVLSPNELTGPTPNELGNPVGPIEPQLFHDPLMGNMPSESRFLINLMELMLTTN